MWTCGAMQKPAKLSIYLNKKPFVRESVLKRFLLVALA
uniref:Uncharacterized protein n=1 Tax=Arundo donax TaxID=35708 RepID=A0A0A9G2U8_ARUDO